MCIWFSNPLWLAYCVLCIFECIFVQLIHVHVHRHTVSFSLFSSCFFFHYFPFFLASVLYTFSMYMYNPQATEVSNWPGNLTNNQ